MPKFYDTMLAEYVSNPGKKVWLDSLAQRYFNYEMISYSEITQKKKLAFQDVDIKAAADYSWEDVYITHKLYKEQKDKKYRAEAIWWEDNDFSVLEDIEIPLMQVLSNMETRGIKINRDILKRIGTQLEQAIVDLEKEIHSLAEEEFNIKSPKQVWHILFEKLWYPSWKKTKTWYSVNAEVLEWLSKQYPIAEKIITYRHFSKLLSTYIEGLLDVVSENDTIHTNYNQTIASTWRLSSTNPNLQNIPSWEGIAGEIRSAFIPFSDSDTLVAFDYSQVEVRLLAIMSQDENLLSAFQQERDIHQVTAEFIFDKKDISSTERKFAKAVNFWVIYWISPFGLSKMIDVAQKEAKKYINSFYESYPKVRDFYEKTIKKCREKWYVETLFWRKRYIAWINDRNKMIQSWAEREAINMPIQWTSADIIKIAMIRIAKMLEDWNYKSTMLLQVHDELVFNILPEERGELLKKIPEIMENILENTPIPLKVDAAEGTNWKECK